MAPEDLPAAVGGVRALGLGGLSVTMPHKERVAGLLDELSPAAAALGAVNTVVVTRHGRLRGENTDGAGFIRALREEQGFDPTHRRCLVVGAGGAARAVVKALADAGADEIIIANRTAARAEEVLGLAAGCGRVGVTADAGEADLVVNATPQGMTGTGMEDRSPVDPTHLGPDQLVVDLVPSPAITPLIEAARSRGAAAANGVGMLVHQAALAFRLWTGRDAPIEEMAAAARAELERRART